MRTQHANRFSTTLTASMGPTALLASVVTTAGSPVSPCYLVIDHDLPASAEIILFDGLFDGTTFRTTALANRYLAGSAAGSGITHAVGAKVISAPLGTSLNDIWDQIVAHAALTNPHSATSAATASRLVLRDASGRAKVAVPSAVDDIARLSTVNDHAALTSPHSATPLATANRLILRDAAGRAKVVDPAVAADIATKGYVDGLHQDTGWIALGTTAGWDLAGGRYRRLSGVVYVVGGWVRVSGANPTAPTFDTLPVGFRPSDIIPTIWRHTSDPTKTGIISAAGAISLDSTTVLTTQSLRFAVAFPADQ